MCERIDYIIQLNICKHIHTCAKSFNKVLDNSSIYLEHNIGEQEELIEMISQPSVEYTTPRHLAYYFPLSDKIIFISILV